MKGRIVAIGFLVVLIGFTLLVFWIGASGGGTARLPPKATGSGSAGTGGSAHTGGELPSLDGGPITKTVADRRFRDELRRRMLEAWAEGEGPVAEAARQGRFEPAPRGEGGGVMDPNYIQSVVREDFMPMAKKCYEELLARKPDAGGRIEMWFKIVGDDKLGGIVEDASVQADGGVADEKMSTCVRESLTTLAFRPPAGDAVVTIGYPIVFSPDDEPDE